MMGPSRGDTICGNVVIEALGPMHFGALALGPIHMASSPAEPKMWLATIERTLLPRSVDVSRFMAGIGELAANPVPGAVPLVLVDREADFCVVGYRAIDGARTLAAIAEAGVDEAAARTLAYELARTLAELHRRGAVHGLLTPTTVIHDGTRWWTWEYGIAGHCAGDRLAPRLRPLGGDAVAPELRAGGEVSPASDVFGWGTAVACLLTGSSGSDAIAMLQESDETDPLRELVRAALESIPELRPQRGDVLLTRLAEILGTPAALPPVVDSSADARFGLPGDPPQGPLPSESSEFSFAELNEPAPTPSHPAQPGGGGPHEIVELLVLGPDDDDDDDDDETGAPQVSATSSSGDPNASPDTSERWRELAEQYLNEAAVEPVPAEAPLPELEPASVADRRSVEALGRVALVRTRVRTGPHQPAPMDHVAVSGEFDMPDEPEPDPSPENYPRSVEGARELPLGDPDDEDEDWEDPDAAVFDLDAPGAPQVGGTVDVDPDPDEVIQRRSAAPWSEPTPVDGLGTRRLVGERSPGPEVTATRPAEPTTAAPALELRAEVPAPRRREPTPTPTPKPAPAEVPLVLAESPRRAEPLRVADPPRVAEPPRVEPIVPRVSLDETPPVSPARARPQSSGELSIGLDRTPSRPIPAVDRAPPKLIPAELSQPRIVRERSGTAIAWSVAVAAGVLAIGATLAAARERGGLSRLFAGEPAPMPTEVDAPQDAAPEKATPSKRTPTGPVAECPEFMRPIEGLRVCIDEAEAPGLREIPQTRVSLDEARAACRDRGARLCTAQQWRAACRGPRNWRHPYGSRAENDRCNGASPSGEIQDLSRTGARDGCVTPSGVYDLEGNVGEWVEDGAVLGGDSTTRGPSCDSRTQPASGSSSPSTGFRCCLDLADPG